MSNSKKKRGYFSGIFLWSGFILLLSIIFYLNKQTIAYVLKKTQAEQIFFGNSFANHHTDKNTTSTVSQKEATENTVSGIANMQIQRNSTKETQSARAKTGQETVIPKKTASGMPSPGTSAPLSSNQPSQDTTTANSQSIQDKKQMPAVPGYNDAKLRKGYIFLIKISESGSISRYKEACLIPYSNSPLTDLLALLLKAPADLETKTGLCSLIPAETKLRSVWVKDGCAFIDLSEEFQFNQYGIDGYLAQLAQIVFTATEFSTVNTVQFLIEGQQKEYLGAEGVWIGTPLSRSSF